MAEMPSTAAPSSKPAGGRRLLLLAGTIVFGVVFGLVAGVAFAAWSAGLLGATGALVAGLVLAWALPLFLSVRAALALKKKKPQSLLLRRLVVLFLVGLVQLTVFLAGFVRLGQGTASTSGEMAAASLPLLQSLPAVGPWLAGVAKEGGAVVDGGMKPADATKPGDGQEPAKPDGTPPSATSATSATAATKGGLEPRAGGRPTATVAVGVQTTEGGFAVVVWQVLFGGQTTARIVDLDAFAALGTPTRVEASVDGFLAVVLGGASLVVVDAAGHAGVDKALSRGAKVGDVELQSVKDVAIGPGGAVLLTAVGFDARTNKTFEALVARPTGGGAPFVVRKAGDVVDEPEKKGDVGNTSHAFALKRGDGSGAVVVEEEIREGGEDVGTKVSGAQWTLNPRRLLAGQLDNPRALAEVVRTGADPSGVDNVTLQAFGDAVLLPDGRVVVDANFVEDGGRGWMFQARAGSGVFAVAPDLVGKPEAPFAERAPRTRHLAVEADGHFAFVNRDGALVTGPLARPAEAKAGLLRADVIGPDGARVGGVAGVTTARLAQGGDWIVAGVDVLQDGGARSRGVVVVGRADLAAGKAELLLLAGGPLPSSSSSPSSSPSPSTASVPPSPSPAVAPAVAPSPAAAPSSSKRVKSLFFDDGHDELVWQPG